MVVCRMQEVVLWLYTIVKIQTSLHISMRVGHVHPSGCTEFMPGRHANYVLTGGCTILPVQSRRLRY